MSVIFDAKVVRISSGNDVIIGKYNGPGRITGIAIGVENGDYSDPFNSLLNIYRDSISDSILTKYININTPIDVSLPFNNFTKVVLSPYNTGTVNVFFAIDDMTKRKNLQNKIVNYIEFSVSPNNTIDIPVFSGRDVEINMIDFTTKSNMLLFSLDTGIYLFKNKPTSSIPSSYDKLSIQGNKILITLENMSSSPISGVLIIKYSY